MSNKTKSKGKITILNDNDGNEVTDDQQKAELLNNYFASVFTKENVTKIPDFVLDTETVTIMNNIAVTEDRIAKHLNTSKASGPDGINARVLKELNVQIAPILKILFNTSITEGKLPYQWKVAHVIALFKKGSKGSANNYRPVSLTSLSCKIHERIIRESIVDKLEGEGW